MSDLTKVYNLPQLGELSTRATIRPWNYPEYHTSDFGLFLEQEQTVKTGHLWWKREKLEWVAIESVDFRTEKRDDGQTLDDFAKDWIAFLWNDEKKRRGVVGEFDSFLSSEDEFFDPEAWLAEKTE